MLGVVTMVPRGMFKRDADIDVILEMKLNEFTIDVAKEKTNLHILLTF